MSAEKPVLTEELLNAMVASAKSGDENAVAQLEDALYGKMRFLALLYNLSEAEADRAVQEGYADVFSNRSILNETVKFEPWVMRKVSEKALAILKEKHHAAGTGLFVYEPKEETGFVYDMADEKNVEEGSLTEDPEERQKILKELFASLSDEKKVISLMYFYEEMSIMEIAGELGITQSNVVDELTEAKKILKEAVPFRQIEEMFHVHHPSPISFFISMLKDEYHAPLYAEKAEDYRELANTMTRSSTAFTPEEVFQEAKKNAEDLDALHKAMVRRKILIIVLLIVLIALGAGALYGLYEATVERRESLRVHEAALQSLRIEFETDENGLEPSVFEYGQGPIDVTTFVKSYQGDLKTSADALDTSSVGHTQITYTLSVLDEKGRKVEWNVVRHYTVVDTQGPEIEFEKETVEITQGDEFDPQANIISVKDPADGNIALTANRPARLINADSGKTYEYNWYMIENDVNINVEGDYTVTVHAEDVHGNMAEKSYHVVVGEKLITKCTDYGPGGVRTSCALDDGKYEGKFTSMRYETLRELFEALRVHFGAEGLVQSEYRILEVCDFRGQPKYYYFQTAE